MADSRVDDDVDFEDLYEQAPCGYLSTRLDGLIVQVNATLLTWLGNTKHELVGRRRFADLLSVGGRIYHETHFAPLLRLQSHVQGIALDLVAADGRRLPVLVAATLIPETPSRPALIRTIVFDASDRRTYEEELLRARQRAEHERARAQILATTLQRTLVPPTLLPPPGMDVAAYYHHASPDEVGGDFYDLFPLDARRWGFFLGDVVGKGAGAAAITSLTRYTLRAAAVNDHDPQTVLRTLDTVLNQEFDRAAPSFCTAIFGVLTPSDTGYAVELASGGHPPALVLRADGSAHYEHLLGGQLVGILPNARFVSTELNLTAGDTLVLYTDGLTEARIGNTKARYDDNGALLEFAAAHAPTTATAITKEIQHLLAGFGAGLEDDAAILAIGIPAT